MGIIINQSLRNAVISYIGIVIGFISTIKLFPNILDSDQFGLTRVLLAIATISVQTINFGIPNSVIRFFPALAEKSNNPGGLFWVFVLPPAFGIFVFGTLFVVMKSSVISLYSDDSALFSAYYLYTIPLVLFLSLFGILSAFVKSNLNTVFASFLQDILLRVITILALILFYYDIINFDQFILLFIANYGLQYLLLLGYSLLNGLISIKPDFSVFNKKQRSEITNYSFFALFSGLTMVLVGNIDLLMISTVEGLSSSGIYAIALYVGAVILIPKKSIAKISFPIIASAFKNGDEKEIKKLYKQTSRNQYLIGLLIYIGVIANLDNLYAMLPPEYAAGGVVILIIGLANLFDMITGANGQIIISSIYYRFDFYSSLLLMGLAIVLNLTFIPKFGIAGAASATALSIFIANFVRVVFVWKKLAMQPFSLPLVGITVNAAIILYASTFIPFINNLYADILVRSLIIATSYLLVVYVFSLSKEVNQVLDTIWTKLQRHGNN